MRYKLNKTSCLLLITSWAFSVFFLIVFFKNSNWWPNTPATIYDLTYLIVFFVFFVLPFISRFKLGPLEVEKKPLEESESDEKPKEPEEKFKTLMELKILNTLWRRQTLKYPKLDGSWTFKLGEAAPEYHEFREAGNRLIGEGLISETDKGYFLITTEGLRYCAEHYETFPPDMWFKDVPIPKDNLETLLKHIKELNKPARGK